MRCPRCLDSCSVPPDTKPVPKGRGERGRGRKLTDQCSGIVLEKVCEYFYYNEKFKNSKDVPDMDIPPELCLELLMAADYLNSEFTLFLSWLLGNIAERCSLIFIAWSSMAQKRRLAIPEGRDDTWIAYGHSRRYSGSH